MERWPAPHHKPPSREAPMAAIDATPERRNKSENPSKELFSMMAPHCETAQALASSWEPLLLLAGQELLQLPRCQTEPEALDAARARAEALRRQGVTVLKVGAWDCDA